MALDDNAFWNGVIRAAAAEPREASLIRGISGLEHPVAAVGIDEDRRRLVVVSTAPEARSAAMAQADIQATMENIQVVMARPVVVNMSSVARELGEALGRPELGTDDLSRVPTSLDGVSTQEEINERLAESMKPYIEKFSPALTAIVASIGLPSIGLLGGIMQAADQLRHVSLTTTKTVDDAGEEASSFRVNFGGLADDDPLAEDVRLGVCPLPLFRFTEADLELVASGPSTDAVRDLLERHGVMPYFFPAPDELALGLIDREQPTVASVLPQVMVAPNIGHPLGQNRFVPGDVDLKDMVEALTSMGFSVAGKQSVKLTDKGLELRSEVKFEPREGMLSKLVNRLSISVNAADFFK